MYDEMMYNYHRYQAGLQVEDIFEADPARFLNEAFAQVDKLVPAQREMYIAGVIYGLHLCGMRDQDLHDVRYEFSRRYQPDGDLYYLIADEDAEVRHV